MVRPNPAVVGLLFLVGTATTASAQTLRGSASTMRHQHAVAVEHDYTFLRTASDVRRFVDLNLLVPIRGNGDYELVAVSFPYGRPELKTFVERLAGQYHDACGERLVVTSLTRPQGRQPANASDLSVHPAGMAVDLRRSSSSRCRAWLERVLLQLEKAGVLDVTRENYPPHYHIALFPNQYAGYVATLEGREMRRAVAANTQPAANARTVAATAPESGTSGPSVSAATVAYKVSRGDSLWSIARAHNTTVDEIKILNGLANARIVAGQVLEVPAR